MASPTQPPNDLVEDLVNYLTPFLGPLIERINVDEFTTVEFIEAMQLDDTTRHAYEQTLLRWQEDNPELAKLVIHGQVIPQALRRGGRVEWAGYAHGEHDPYAVPAWWRKVAAP